LRGFTVADRPIAAPKGEQKEENCHREHRGSEYRSHSTKLKPAVSARDARACVSGRRFPTFQLPGPSPYGTRSPKSPLRRQSTTLAFFAGSQQGSAMGLFTKDIKTMDDLFLHTLQDIYYAENKIVKSLPEMIGNATDAQLKNGLQAHLGETKGHVRRLEQVFQMLGQKSKSVDCPAIDGIIDEAEDVTGEVDDKNVLDAAIIAAGQAVEHYEITRYGALIAWANLLGRSDVAKVLEQTLSEEKAADRKLTEIAESKVNQKAA
jgi:ferritin-like metal-binding protein YciE